MDNAEILKLGKERFKLVCAAEKEQRKDEREALQFMDPKNQWSDAAKIERMGSVQGNTVVPARPMLSISIIEQPIQLILNAWAKSRLGVQVHPVNETASQELAEIKQGLYRRIERDGKADQARGWALDRAVKAGRGYYRVKTKYDEDADLDGPGAWDQEIVFERILFQDCVYFDPSAEKPDFSDAKWCILTHWMDEEAFKKCWPKAEGVGDNGEWEDATGADGSPEWVRHTETGKTYLVAEHWFKVIETEEITGPNGQKREREHVTVFCAYQSGGEVLEVTEWNGHYIPIIPVIGEEEQPVDGKRRWTGMVKPAKDGQMLYNYAASTLVERLSLEPKTPWIVEELQVEGYEDEWQQANTRNLPFLRYKSSVQGDKQVPPPFRAPIDGGGMSLAVMGLNMAKDFVQATTAVYAPALGQLPEKRESQSGRAILALQQQSDAGTSQFVQNLADISIPYETKVVMDLMPVIYDRPGRVTQVLGMDDEPKAVMLGQHYVSGTNGPQPSLPNAPGAKFYDLTQGRYSVDVTVGKNPATRLEAGQQFLTAMAQAYPQMMDIAGDLFFKFQDQPGAKEIAERLHKMIMASHPNLFDDKANDPARAQAQVQALTQQLQALQQQSQQMADALKTDQAKQQAQVMIAQLKLEAELEQAKIKQAGELQRAQMDNAAKIEVARINAAKEALNQEAAAQEELLATSLQVHAEAQAQGRDHAHEARMAVLGQADNEAMEPAPDSEGAEGEA